MRQKVIVIVGPTASGKSALAVELAKRFKGEVISADSRQVYRGLDIGSGKITKPEMRGVKHHLLDVVSPRNRFTAHDFVRYARKAYSNILRNHKIPIVVGGTGFYIDALLGRASLPNVPANAKLRAKLQKLPAPTLFQMLRDLDRERAENIDRHNPVRLIRAIEIAKSTASAPPIPHLDAEAFWIGLMPEKEHLRKKIQLRLRKRMPGILREVKRLHGNGLSWKRMDELGLEYRYVAGYLRGLMSKKEMEVELENKIRHYAKRQNTYWRRNKNIQWFDPKDTVNVMRRVKKFLV